LASMQQSMILVSMNTTINEWVDCKAKRYQWIMQQSIGGGGFANHGKGYVERTCCSTKTINLDATRGLIPNLLESIDKI
jgi:hypothetical protein